MHVLLARLNSLHEHRNPTTNIQGQQKYRLQHLAIYLLHYIII